MYDFNLIFSNGKEYAVKNVQKVIYPKRDMNHVVAGDKIMSERIPAGDMSLYAGDKCVSISGKDLLMIDITKHVD